MALLLKQYVLLSRVCHWTRTDREYTHFVNNDKELVRNKNGSLALHCRGSKSTFKWNKKGNVQFSVKKMYLCVHAHRLEIEKVLWVNQNSIRLIKTHLCWVPNSCFPWPRFERLIKRDSYISNKVFVPWFLNENYLVFEFVGILVFFLVEIDEVMSNAILGFRIHVPRNLEGITRDVTYFDVVWDWKLLHLCNPTILWFIPCIENKHDSFSEGPVWSVFCVLQYKHIPEQPFTKAQRGSSGASGVQLCKSGCQRWKALERDEIPRVNKH